MSSWQFIILFFVFSCHLRANALDPYLPEFDAQPFEEVISDPKYLADKGQCIMGKVQCDNKEAAYYRDNLPEMVATYCEECSEPQVRKLFKYMVWFTFHEPQLYQEAMSMFKNTISRKMLMHKLIKNRS